jgi:hypothetical protein
MFGLLLVPLKLVVPALGRPKEFVLTWVNAVPLVIVLMLLEHHAEHHKPVFQKWTRLLSPVF